MTPPRVRVGITLPQFRDDPGPALSVARRAEDEGLDGVFVFDHMWPLRQPDRPALYSLALLGALAAETSRLTIGPLVARVGMMPDAVLVHALASLHRMVGPRLLVTLGTGDSANRDENEAYGVPFTPVADRVARLVACCRSLRHLGVRTWVGGRSAAVRRAAADADGWNSWATDVPTFAGLVASLAGAVPTASWGGQVLVGRTPEDAREKLARHGPRPELVHGTVADLAAHITALAGAGATWVVCAPLDVGTDPKAVEYVAEAAAAAR
jgi:alkanesulfonate monooxygenase SsuD/methylene tetrahydromethanopterin reductase-like flavin-dependent oxidoreductase (luciferase family)